MHTFSHIHFPTYIFPHTYTFFTYIFHIQMYVCDPKFHTYIHFGKKMYVPHTYVYVCKMFTDICSHTLVCTTLVHTSTFFCLCRIHTYIFEKNVVCGIVTTKGTRGSSHRWVRGSYICAVWSEMTPFITIIRKPITSTSKSNNRRNKLVS